MNAGPTTERVYHALKERITGIGVRPGERLDPNALASALDTSVTPIRDALHRLAGEQLVDVRLHEGFHIPLLGEGRLRELYMWNGDVLALALRGPMAAAARGRDDSGYAERPRLVDGAIVARTAALFAAIAAIAGNAEIERAIGSANERLHAPREAETVVIQDGAGELRAMGDAFAGKDIGALRKQLRSYHRRRAALVSEIVRVRGRGDTAG